MKFSTLSFWIAIPFLLLLSTPAFATDWQTFYDECEKGIAGTYFIFDKKCKWQKMSCEDYANFSYDWKAWKTGSSFPKWAARDKHRCPDGSYIESTWPRLGYKGTGTPTPRNEPGSISRTPPPPVKPDFRSSEENYQRKLENAQYVASVQMESYIDDALLWYIDWARNSGVFDAQMQGLEVDGKFNEYRECVLGVLSSILTDENGIKAGNLSKSQYKNFFEQNFVIGLQECGDLVP